MTKTQPRDLEAELDELKAEVAALKRAFMADASEQKLRGSDRPMIVAEAIDAALEALAKSADGRET